MEYLIIAAQLILSLSILVVLHEWGHFFPARLFGTRVEKFYLFFDPWFSLFKKKIGDTEYGIGWLPLGGYVKISGMMDESFDKEQLAEEPKPWEFRSKPAWQRLIIMLGGVTVNFILGFLLFGMVLFIWGEKYLPNANVKDGIHVSSFAKEMGLQHGDKIISVAGQPLDNFRTLRAELIFDQARTIQVERNGKKIDIPVTREQTQKLASNKIGAFVVPRVPFKVAKVPEDNVNSGLIKPGDQVTKVIHGKDTTDIRFFDEFQDLTKQYCKRNISEITIHVIRDGQAWVPERPIQLDTCGRIGVFATSDEEFLEYKTQEYTLAQALPAGVKKGWNFLADNVKGFALMFKGDIKASDSLGGFGTIASLFPEKWEWQRFWYITAVLSLILAFMNILPIPLLDGGHVMFLLYEMVVGRPPSDKFLEYSQMVGLVLVFGLLIYANGMDVWRAWSGSGGPVCTC